MNYLKMIIGNVLCTSAYAFISVPKGIVNGGVTSFAMVLGKIAGIDVAALTNGLLTLLLLACFLFLGRAYFLNALFSGACYMILFTTFHHMGVEVDLPFAVSVPAAAALVGVGMYFCIVAKSTTVGFDTVAIILHDRNPRVPIALTMYVCNLAVLSLGLLSYGWMSIAAGVVFAGIQSFTLHVLLRHWG